VVAIASFAAAYALIIAAVFVLNERDIRSGWGLVAAGVAPEHAGIGPRCREIAGEYALSPREEEVLCFLARGRNADFISKTLVISTNTAKAHIYHIYQKLGIHTQQELLNLIETPRRS
jgi:DNA-binding CsgD family transcriptional regulator